MYLETSLCLLLIDSYRIHIFKKRCVLFFQAFFSSSMRFITQQQTTGLRGGLFSYKVLLLSTSEISSFAKLLLPLLLLLISFLRLFYHDWAHLAIMVKNINGPLTNSNPLTNSKWSLKAMPSRIQTQAFNKGLRKTCCAKPNKYSAHWQYFLRRSTYS